jgi:hyperosmotically inducible periplasmic protein
MRNVLGNLTLTLAGALLLAPFAQGAISTAEPKAGLTSLEQEVRHELVMLPWFGVFDNLQFQVQGDHVILSGQVTRPTLRSGAENVVKRIEGVERITNNIEVLPLSPFDDDIRLAAVRSIYGFGPLNRYAMGTQPPIRIIVKNGNITLQGVVANEMDAQMAYMRARQVPGAFSVTSELRVENTRS